MRTARYNFGHAGGPGAGDGPWVRPAGAYVEGNCRPSPLAAGGPAKGFIQALGLKIGAMAARGDPLYPDEGADHVGSATPAYRDDRIYDWLLDKHLPVQS